MARRRILLSDNIDDNFIDLGLPSGVLWAKCNIGAENEHENGLFFSRGNIEGHQEGYDFSQAHFNGTTGSNLSGKQEIPNDITYDVVRYTYGVGYGLPTVEQYEELQTYTTYSVDDYGYTLTSTINGNTLYFPKTGYYDGTTKENVRNCTLWASDATTDSLYKGLSVNIRTNTDFVLPAYRLIYNGCVIRGVKYN